MLIKPIKTYSHASRQRAELEADYSSVCPSVRVCVPLLGEAQNLCFCTILSEISENHLCILQVLSSRRPQNAVNISLQWAESQHLAGHGQRHNPSLCDNVASSPAGFLFLKYFFANVEAAALAADLITAWKPLRGGWKLHRKLGTTL